MATCRAAWWSRLRSMERLPGEEWRGGSGTTTAARAAGRSMGAPATPRGTRRMRAGPTGGRHSRGGTGGSTAAWVAMGGEGRGREDEGIWGAPQVPCRGAALPHGWRGRGRAAVCCTCCWPLHGVPSGACGGSSSSTAGSSKCIGGGSCRRSAGGRSGSLPELRQVLANSSKSPVAVCSSNPPRGPYSGAGSPGRCRAPIAPWLCLVVNLIAGTLISCLMPLQSRRYLYHLSTIKK